MGLSSAVTIGNKIDLNENDILSYWLSSHKEVVPYRTGMAHVMPVGMYLESISDGEEFVRLCRKLVVSHPLFVLKPGKSSEAKKAMQSHTGAIAGEDAVLETALSHAGVIRCEGMEDFFDLTKAFSWEDAPKGPRVAVVSNAGGPAVISADLIASYGLSMAKLSKETQDKLDDVLPRSASLKNPVDVLGDALADRYESALHAVLAEENVDGLIVILTPQVMTQIEETAKVIGSLSRQYRKPILCAFIGGSRISAGERLLNGFKIPVFRFPERAIYAFSKMWQWMETKTAIAAEREVEVPRPSTKELDIDLYGLVLASLKEAGVVSPPTVRVSTLDEAVHFFKRQKGKVVLKLYAPELLHKKEMDAVIVNIETQTQLAEAFGRIRKSQDIVRKTLGVGSTVYIQRMEKIEIEMLVGIKTDPQFGKVLLFGAGGALSELIADRNMVLLPTTPSLIRSSLQKAKVFKLLSGFRGEKPYDVGAVVDAIYAFTLWVQKHPAIREAEINPLIINRTGLFAVDVKVQTTEMTQ
jgi:acetyltransferase